MSVEATGARITGTFLPAATAGTLITFLVTGFNMSVEDRPQIDVTKGSDTIMAMVPGKRGTTTVTVNARFDQSQIAQVNADLLVCGHGELKIYASRKPEGAATDCDFVAVAGVGTGAGDGDITAFDAFLMGYTVEGSMDSAVDMTLNFLIRSNGTAVGVIA